jgi:hypothetical protein
MKPSPDGVIIVSDFSKDLEGTNPEFFLRQQWNIFNAAYFDKSLSPIAIRVVNMEAEIGKTYVGVYFYNKKLKERMIYLNEQLVYGHHDYLRPGKEYAHGRYRLMSDVLLHEMIHQYQREIMKNPGYTKTKRYCCHGKSFCQKASEIAKKIGLEKVRPNRQPASKQWPGSARDKEYYLGSYDYDHPLNWIDRNWTTFGSWAWHGYCQNGLGMVVLTVDKQHKIKNMEYLPADSIDQSDMLKLSHKRPFIDITDSVQTYNPQNEALILYYVKLRNGKRYPWGFLRLATPEGCSTPPECIAPRQDGEAVQLTMVFPEMMSM